MVWIQASASYQGLIRVPCADILDLLWDVSASGPLFPGVDRIESLGDARYRWVIKERRTLGVSFIGNYVAEYERTADAVIWTTVEGNMKTRGRWRVHGPDREARVHVEATTELDAPVPRFLKAPAQLFATKETRDGLKAQFEGLRATLERGGRAATR